MNLVETYACVKFKFGFDTLFGYIEEIQAYGTTFLSIEALLPDGDTQQRAFTMGVVYGITRLGSLEEAQDQESIHRIGRTRAELAAIDAEREAKRASYVPDPEVYDPFVEGL